MPPAPAEVLQFSKDLTISVFDPHLARTDCDRHPDGQLGAARQRFEDERAHTETRLADQRIAYEARLADLRGQPPVPVPDRVRNPRRGRTGGESTTAEPAKGSPNSPDPKEHAD